MIKDKLCPQICLNLFIYFCLILFVYFSSNKFIPLYDKSSEFKTFKTSKTHFKIIRAVVGWVVLSC